ncbi:MAG: hypothetical protein MI810_22645 [Flavobacteriales bacterium]|jgi:hypothetical protein|nr:hypothetical protein [Flavobacteriales bacterium]
MKIQLLFIALLFGGLTFGQSKSVKTDSARYVQMSGIVITDSLYRVPFTTVADLTTNRGVIADYYGYFALVVHPGDTLLFSSLGYKKKQYIVPDTISVESFSLVQIMEYDTIQADPVDVYPWPSKEQFATYFVEMDVDDDDLVRARQRLTPQEMAFVGTLMVSDGASSYSAYRTQFNQEMYTRGQSGQNNLLNPAAWSEFLKGIGTGKYQISQ